MYSEDYTDVHMSSVSSYILTHKWLLDIKQRKTSLQFTISENLNNKKNPKETYMDLIYMGSKIS